MPTILPALIFLVGSLGIPLLKGRARRIYVIVVALLGLLDTFALKIQNSWMADYMGFEVTLLHVDRISLFVGYIFVIIGFFAVIYSLHVDEKWHFILAFWYVGSSLGAVFAGDMLSLYLWWEIMAVASAGLIFLRFSDESKQAGYRYLLMHLIGGAAFVGGILVNYSQTGSLVVGPMEPGLGFILVLVGVGMNAGFVLLHTWLPDAYPRAPFTASVFMSVYTTKTAVYALARLAPGWDFVAYMGAGMAVFGVTMALIQGNARKLLSYHIVSQVGYMVAAIGLGGVLGVNGGLAHLFNHILYKALLFMTIGAVIYRTGTEQLSELGGLARKMPVTTAAAVVASLSIAGAPFFNGFISKSIIFQAAESNVAIELLLELAAVGTFLSFLKFTYYGFFRPNKELEARVKEVPSHMALAMGGTAALCFAIGVFPGVFVEYLPFALTPAESAFYTFSRVSGVTQIMVVTVALFFLAKVFSPHKRITFDFDWFYIQIGKGLQVVAEGVSRINNGAEEASGLLSPALLSLRRPVAKVNELASRLLLAVFADMWLFRPISQSATEAWKRRQAESQSMVAAESTDGGTVVGDNPDFRLLGLDLSPIDRAVGFFSKIGARLSALSGLTDKYVVDGLVNGIAWLTAKAGRELRPIQTGDVQSYGFVMVSGAIIIVFIVALSFYGVLTLT